MKADKTEQELLTGLANKDAVCVEIIYKKNFDMVLSLITRNAGTYDDARDVFQEGIMVLYEKSKSKNFHLSSQIKTYLYAVCRKIWLKKLQLQGRYFVYSDSDIDETGLHVNEDLEDAKHRDATFDLMEKALGKLGEPCKSLLENFYIHKKGMSELVEMFGYTNVDNAKTQKYKCLMRLKKLFFAEYKK